MMGSKVTEKRQRRRILAVALAVAAVTGMGYAATNAAGKSQAEPVTLNDYAERLVAQPA